jgi:hypothetical protein
MCGRYVPYGPGEALIQGFSLVDLPPLSARYNVAPAGTVLVVRAEPGRERVAEPMRWGLVPHWARDASIGARLVNARGETVAARCPRPVTEPSRSVAVHRRQADRISPVEPSRTTPTRSGAT